MYQSQSGWLQSAGVIITLRSKPRLASSALTLLLMVFPPLPHLCSAPLFLYLYPPTLTSLSLGMRTHSRNSSVSPVWIIMRYPGIHNPDQLIAECATEVYGTRPCRQQWRRGLLEKEGASATMPARKPYISQVSLLTYTHTHLCRLYGGIQEAFPADWHKKGAGLWVEKPAQEEKKKSSPPPPPLLIPHSLSLSPPPSPTNLSPWPLQCCAVPAGFQGAANGLRLIYMQLGWDTCRPSSPSNGAAQESRLNTAGDR